MTFEQHNKSRKKILFLVEFAVLLGVEVLFCFTPLGSIPFTPVIVATTAMLPVIITSILLGTGAGTLMGAFAGLFSFLIWTFYTPNPLIAFLFTPFYSLGEVQGNFYSVLICFVPRIAIGFFSGILFHSLRRVVSKNKIAEVVLYAASGLIGSLANTLLVLAGWYFFFAEEIAKVFQIDIEAVFDVAVFATFITNGLPEMAVSVLIAVLVCIPVRKNLIDKNRL